MLRTHGRMAEAVAVIHRALDQGVTYCDTAPAYAGSLDYYGAALGERRGRSSLPPRPTTVPVMARSGFSMKASSGCAPTTSTCGNCTICEPPAT